MKKFISCFLATAIVLSCFFAVSISSFAADNVEITEAKGWLESAYACWNKSDSFDGYNVYYKKSDSNDYTKIDAELIREYPTYWRADVPGLAAGDYTLKIIPQISGIEETTLSAESEVLNVKNYLREGYAFYSGSVCGTTNGGYNSDGTVKSDADIVYVTDWNKDTVTVGGDSSKGEGLVGIFSYRDKNKSTNPMILRLLGKITPPAGLETDAMLKIMNTNNITIEGIGDDATTYEWSLSMKRTQNMEVRNVAVMLYGGGTDGDGISMDTDNKNIWLHNMDFFYGAPGKDADQVKGDGSVDLKSKTDYITLSYNHFWDSGKTAVSGGPWEVSNANDERAKIHVSYHHNWFDHSDSRHPRCVAGTNHVYNNYYDGVSNYGIGCAVQSSIFVENNYFRNCPRPMIIATQGSDVYDSATGTYATKGTLSGQTGGMIKEFGNHIEGAKRFVNQNTTPDEGQIDAYSASSRDEVVPDTVKAMSGGSTYNNFDTSAEMYDYSIQTPDEAKESVMTYAGRINGGDFKWAFNNDVEDSNHAIIPELKEALVTYQSELVSVPAIPNIIPDPTGTPDPNATPSPTPTATPGLPAGGEITHNFSTQGLNSDYFTFSETCQTSTGYGSIKYKDLTLNTCLKVGTGTTISFTALKNGKATLVFTTTSGKVDIKINGAKTSGDATTGLLSFDVVEGTNYLLEKQDSSYLYYIDVVYDGSSEPSATPEITPTAIPTAIPNVPTVTKKTYNTANNSADVKIINAKDENITIIVGEYNELGMLVNTYFETKTVLTHDEEYTINAPISPTSTAKVFVWYGTDTLKPLNESL